jgi:FKBP-type peptidyl-prolyl cis-trans isomerase (trigger factor)
MATPEKYNKYKEISRPNAEKIVKLGLAFRDISEKEKISVTESEIREQLDLLSAQVYFDYYIYVFIYHVSINNFLGKTKRPRSSR